MVTELRVRSQKPGEDPGPIKAVKANFTAENAENAEKIKDWGESSVPVKAVRAIYRRVRSAAS